MTAEQITIYAACDTDDRGYALNHLAYFPIQAAANAYLSTQNLGGYCTVQTLKAIRLADVMYLFEKEVAEKALKNSIQSYTPVECYRDYSYSSLDNSAYYFGIENLKLLLDDGKDHHLSKVLLLKDSKKVYLLRKKEPIELTKFLESREMATAHALSKLTEEEKKLLGLA